MASLNAIASARVACWIEDVLRNRVSPTNGLDKVNCWGWVLWTTDHCIVLINRFPYTNGHLLIAPRAHKADFEQLTDAEHLDLQTQTSRAIKLLKRAVSAQGFNIGINIGRCAGAGLPGHVHQHIVPRWAGDTNFISVVGEVRVVPQAMSQLYEELMRCQAEL